MMPHSKSAVLAACLAAAVFVAAPAAAASRQDAAAAIGRADAKIELVSRNAAQPGMPNDQSYNDARQRMEQARAAEKSNRYERAEWLADEAGQLAELTGERAKLAALLANLAAATSSLDALQKIGQSQ